MFCYFAVSFLGNQKVVERFQRKPQSNRNKLSRIKLAFSHQYFKVARLLIKSYRLGAGRTRQNFSLPCKKNFLVCLVSQNPLACTFQHAYRYGIMLIQKHAKLKRTSMQQVWTEKISLVFRNKISIFSGFREQLALHRTCHY